MVDGVELLPGMEEVAIAAVDLRHQRDRAIARGAEEQLHCAPVLDPGIGVDPEIEIMAGEMAGQERPGEQGLAMARRLGLAREIEIPARRDDLGTARGEPGALGLFEADVENAKGNRGALRLVADRGDASLQQAEIAAARATDDDPARGGHG